ncbi:MAG TPA: flagellar biosynthetic protein FliR [Polyangiaceae bacterium]
MMLESMLLREAGGFALVASRIGGFVVGSPFPGNYVSKTQRVGLVLVLGWVATPIANFGSVPIGLNAGLVVSSVLEIACGIAIGLTFRFVIAAGEVAGSAIAQASGLNSATTMNPSTQSAETALGRAITLFTMLLALTTGVHRLVLSYLLESFRALPVGSDIHIAGTLPLFTALAQNSLVVGVRLALPVIAVSLVIQLTLAMIARAAPSLQIFNVGLSIMVMTTLVIMLDGIREVGSGMATELQTMGPHLDALFVRMAGH